MTSNAPAVLSTLSSQLLGVHAKVKDLEKGFTRLYGVVSGGVMIAGGAAGLSVLNKMADKGKELIHQQELMRQAGFKQVEINQAVAKSWDLTRRVQTTVASENLKHIRELTYVTGDMNSAISVLGPVSKANAILNSVSQSGDRDQVFELVKSLESKGLATAEERQSFLSYIDMMVRANQATGGRVTPKMFMSTLKYARTAKYGWNEEFITQILPRMMQEWASGGGGGGSGVGGPGNALMSGYSQIVSGVMGRKAAAQLSAIGLATIHGNKDITRAYASVKDEDLFITNPYEWVQRDLVPKLIAKDGHDVKKILSDIGKMFPTRTWGSAISEFVLQGRAFLGDDSSPYEKDRRQTLKALGLSGFDPLSIKDPNLVGAIYDSQMENLGEAIGSPLAQLKVDVLRGVIPFIEALTKLSQTNPQVIRNIAIGFGILSAALIGGGAVTILAALGPAGWLAAGIIALGAALVIFKRNWIDDAAKWFQDNGTYKPSGQGAGTGNSLLDAWKALKAIYSVLWSIATIPTKVGFGLLKDFVTKFFPAIGSIKWNPADFGKFATELENWSNKVVPMIDKVPGMLVTEVETWAPRVGKSITAFGSSIVKKIEDEFSNIGHFFGFGGSSGSQAAPKKSSYVTPGVGAPKNRQAFLIENHIHLDGKVIAKSVTKRQTQLATMPLGVHGAPDSYASFVGSGTTFQPA